MSLRPRPAPSRSAPEDEERDHVRQTLAALDSRAAELLLLRSHGLSYAEVAAGLDSIRRPWGRS